MKYIIKGWCDECMKQNIPVVEMETGQSRFCIDCLRASVQMLEQAQERPQTSEEMDAAFTCQHGKHGNEYCAACDFIARMTTP